MFNPWRGQYKAGFNRLHHALEIRAGRIAAGEERGFAFMEIGIGERDLTGNKPTKMSLPPCVMYRNAFVMERGLPVQSKTYSEDRRRKLP